MRDKNEGKNVRRSEALAFLPSAAATFSPYGVTTSSPDDQLQADELQQRLAAALARLPQRQADAFVLLRLEGLETAEVAGILGCSEPTVRVHLHRAMIRLARELHEYLGP
jgi:RNA polymerase sigma factor (sigma-70 family)